MDFNPLVSIIIPVYNGGNYLREAIDSALAQTYSNVEVLVINDGSNDNGETETIALSYGDKIRYFCKENGGVATALNLGIACMKGDYFSWLSHDDLYYPEKIMMQVGVLAKLADKRDIIFSGFMVIDSAGNELNRVLPLERYGSKQLETPLFALLHGMISGCSLLIHKSHFERVGTFREDLLTTQDFELWFRMMCKHPCRICEGILHMTRVHEGQGSKTQLKLYRQEGNSLWINIMKQLTDEEKIQIGGSVQEFYRNVYLLLLKYTTNYEAIRHAKKHAVNAVGMYGIVKQCVFELSSGYVLMREAASVFKRKLTVFRRGTV